MAQNFTELVKMVRMGTLESDAHFPVSVARMFLINETRMQTTYVNYAPGQDQLNSKHVKMYVLALGGIF